MESTRVEANLDQQEDITTDLIQTATEDPQDTFNGGEVEVHQLEEKLDQVHIEEEEVKGGDVVHDIALHEHQTSESTQPANNEVVTMSMDVRMRSWE